MTEPRKRQPEEEAFDRFQDLTRRLVAVPKDEVDAKRKREKASKRS